MTQARIVRAMLGAVVGSALPSLAGRGSGTRRIGHDRCQRLRKLDLEFDHAHAELRHDAAAAASAGAPTGLHAIDIDQSCHAHERWRHCNPECGGLRAVDGAQLCVDEERREFQFSAIAAGYSAWEYQHDDRRNTSYQVKICNGAACTGSLPATPLAAVVPAASVSGGGGGDGSISCSAKGFPRPFSTTGTGQARCPSWTPPTWRTPRAEGCGIQWHPRRRLYAHRTADNNNLSFIDAIGYPSPNQGNVMTLSISTQPCDLSIPDPGTS